MESQFKKFSLRSDRWITDRSPIDILAYLLVNVNGECDSQVDGIMSFIQTVEKMMSKYIDTNFIVRMSPEIDRLSLYSDKNKVGNTYSSYSYRKAIDLMVVGISIDMSRKIDSTIIKIPEECIQIDDRVEFIKRMAGW